MIFSCYSPAFSNCFSSSINSRRIVGLENDNKEKYCEKSDALTCALQNNTRFCKRSQSFGPGTSNRKLTVLCDSMECSREQQTSSADLHPTTTMRLFVPAFPSKSQAIQTSIGREKTCHISALFLYFKAGITKGMMSALLRTNHGTPGKRMPKCTRAGCGVG